MNSIIVDFGSNIRSRGGQRRYDSGKLTNLIYYFTVNKLIASQFAVVGNKKVTVTEFICMLPQIISLGTGKGM